MWSSSAGAGSTTPSTTASSRTSSPRPAKGDFFPPPLAGEGRVGALQDLDPRRRDVAGRHDPISLEVHFEDRCLADLLVIHLALVLRTAIQQDPGGLQWIGMADQQRYLVRVLAGDTMDHIEHPPAERLDRFVAGQASSSQLVHEESGPPHRHLPAAHALQVTAELGFAQFGLRNQGHRRRQLPVDDLGSLARAVERTVHDAPYAALSQCLSDGGRLGSPMLAEKEARK